MLGQYFSNVERRDYIDSLSITDTNDLIDWLKSTISAVFCTEKDFEDLYHYFEEMRKRDGVISIPKEVGLFVSVSK